MADARTETIEREAEARGMMSPAEARTTIIAWKASQGRYDLPQALDEALDVLVALVPGGAT